jgi:putative acetyltransferase
MTAQPTLSIGVERAGRADVRALLEAALVYSLSLYPAQSCHGLDLAAFDRADVTLFVARLEGQAVGCGGMLRHTDGTAEIKSMFVDPRVRGHGVGQAILAALEASVRGHVRRVLLETGTLQHEAIRLYEAAGYRRRPPFGDYRDDPLSVFMEKPLAGWPAGQPAPAPDQKRGTMS